MPANRHAPCSRNRRMRSIPGPRSSSSPMVVTACAWYRSRTSQPSSCRDSSNCACTPFGFDRSVLAATNRRSRTSATAGPTTRCASPYCGAMSRWLTPASSARCSPRAASSGVDIQKAAPPRMATLLSCPVRPNRLRSMPRTLRQRRRPSVAAALGLEPFPDERAPLLEVAVRELFHRVVDAEARLHARHVELPGVGVEPDLCCDALAVRRREVHRDLRDLAEDVEVGCQR